MVFNKDTVHEVCSECATNHSQLPIPPSRESQYSQNGGKSAMRKPNWIIFSWNIFNVMLWNYLAKLLSCMDQFRSILGDHCDEEEATAAILKHNFDLEKAIDDVLNEGKPK